ncbi:hypothetical protein GY45DRAFT_209256 [Cubamyces sp. BRFM 1775]|nr:hypothetical protein GY45DRAFT_209256 [Cubamyces sp. BRFM 1775]
MPPPAGLGCSLIRPASARTVSDAPAVTLSRRNRGRRDETLVLTVVVTIAGPSATASPSTTVPAALGIMSDTTPTPTLRSPVDDHPQVDHDSANGSSSSVNPSSLALKSGLAGGVAALLGTIIMAGILFVFHRVHRNRCRALKSRDPEPEPEQCRSYEAITPYSYDGHGDDTLVLNSKRVSLILPLGDINPESRPPTYYSNIQGSPLPIELSLPDTARTRSRSIIQSLQRSPSASTRVDLRPEFPIGSKL